MVNIGSFKYTVHLSAHEILSSLYWNLLQQWPTREHAPSTGIITIYLSDIISILAIF